MYFDVLFTINLFFQNPSGRQKEKPTNQPTKTTPKHEAEAALTTLTSHSSGRTCSAPGRLSTHSWSDLAPPASLDAPSLPYVAAAASLSPAHDAVSRLPSPVACHT